MNDIQIFSNPQFGAVRVAEMNGQPIFCLVDVCKSLGIKEVSRCASRLDEEVRQTHPLHTAGGMQQATFITESGLYEVIIRSDAPAAKPFRKWVTSDVLPSIRKHGAYATPDTVEKMIENPDFAIQLLQSLKEERTKRLAVEAEREAVRPKELFADAVATSARSCLVAELAKILQQNGIHIGQNRLFDWLRKNGYLCSKGEYYNQPTQRAMEMGLFEVKKTAINKPDGSVLVSCTTKITGRGQVYFVNKFLNRAA